MATDALVFKARGLSSKCKQPVGYFLNSGPSLGKFYSYSFVQDCVNRLTNIGLSVKPLICDRRSNNCQFLDILVKVTCDRPFTKLGSKHISIIHDPPDLLKNVRNNFKKLAFIMNDQPITWQYVTQFYGF